MTFSRRTIVTPATIRLFGMVFVLAGGGHAPVKADDKPVAKWEYRVVTKDQIAELGKKDLAAGLNKLGEEGWELVVIDGGYIFKRLKPQTEKEIADVKLRIAIINRDIEMQKDRLAWSVRMLRMGYLSQQAVLAEQERLTRIELVLERTTRELDKLVPPPKEPIPVAPPPTERKAEK
jgi:hypothetical protein